MPKDFLNCIKNGGKVRTIKPSPGKYLHICYINGKSYPGEVKETKKTKKRNIVKKAINKK